MGLPPVTNCNYPEMALSSKNCGSTSLALQLLPASGDRPSGYVYSFSLSLSLSFFSFQSKCIGTRMIFSKNMNRNVDSSQAVMLVVWAYADGMQMRFEEEGGDKRAVRNNKRK